MLGGLGGLKKVGMVVNPVGMVANAGLVNGGKDLISGGNGAGVLGGYQEAIFGKDEAAPPVDPTMYRLDTAAANPYVQQQAAQGMGAAAGANAQLGTVASQQQQQAQAFGNQMNNLGAQYQNANAQQADALQNQAGAMSANAYNRGGAMFDRGAGAFQAGQGLIGGAGDVQGRQGVQLDQSTVQQALGQANDARGAQMGVAGGLGQFAQQGPGASVAEAQLGEALNRNMAQNVALARSGRGWGGGSAAMSQAVDANAMAQQQAAGQAATLRAQEADAFRARQLQALGMQGQVLGQARGQDFSGGALGLQGATTQAGLADAQMARNDAQQLGLLGAGTNLQNTGLGFSNLGANLYGQGNQAYLGAQGLAQGAIGQGANAALGFGQAGQQAQQFNTQAQSALVGQQFGNTMAGLGMGQDLTQAQLDAQIQQEQLRINPGAAMAQQANAGKQALTGGLIGAAGAIVSDKRAKTNIREVTGLEEGLSLLDIPAYEYDYKDEKNGKGRHLGPMAQDLEKTEARSAVFDTPEGKKVDTRRLTLANTAAMSTLSRRLKDLQKEVLGMRENA